jgi:hypothetical protein
MTHDYIRLGTTSLFAVLEVASGKVHGRCFQRHTHVEFIAFLESLARRYPKQELHLICDNYGTHKHPAVQDWCAAHPQPHRGRNLQVQHGPGIRRQTDRHRRPLSRSARASAASICTSRRPELIYGTEH